MSINSEPFRLLLGVGTPGPFFPDALRYEMNRLSHPWRVPDISGKRTVGELVSDGHLGMRSRSGVPLNGAQAFKEGFGRGRCPYTWGTGPVPYHDLWMIEWSVAERALQNKDGSNDA